MLRIAARPLSLVAAALALVVVTAGPAVAIANGEPVIDGQYTFSVKLTMTNIPRPDGTRYDSACSGALVASSWVITAGHCFHDVNRNPVSGPVPYPTTATVGRTDVADTDGYVVNVVEVRQARGRDVALARIDRTISDVPPIGIRTTAPIVGEVLRLTGWGATSGGSQVPATHLQTGQVQVSTVASTTVGVHGYAPFPDTSACVYDSGAPYFVERTGATPLLVSVESDGPDCPHTQVETTARVDSIAKWIKRTIGP